MLIAATPIIVSNRVSIHETFSLVAIIVTNLKMKETYTTLGDWWFFKSAEYYLDFPTAVFARTIDQVIAIQSIS